MSIIIYHQEQQIDQEQIKALQKFYGCEHVIQDYDYGPDIPAGTLAFMKHKEERVLDIPLNGYDYLLCMRKIHINTAFAEMAQHLGGIIGENPVSQHFRVKLKEFLAQQRGEIFTLEDVIMFLGMSPGGNGGLYVIPSIEASLEQFGCSKEYVTIFTPPAGEQQIFNQSDNREAAIA